MTFRGNLFSVLELLTIFIFVLTICLFIKYFYNKRKLFRLGAKLPGPKPWPIIGNTLDFLKCDFDILGLMQRFKIANDLLAVWLGHHLLVFIYTPDLIEAACQSTKLLDRSDKLQIAMPVGQKGLILASGAPWRKAKKIMESALPYSVLKNFIPVFQEEGNILVKNLESEVGKPCFALHPYLKKCTFDIISEVTVELKEKAQVVDVALLRDVDAIVHLSFKRLFTFWHHWDFLYKKTSNGKEFSRLLNSLMKKADEEINKRRNQYEENKQKVKCEENIPASKKKYFWQALIDDETLTLDESRDHVFTMLFAGFETSSNAICFVLVMLALHQDVQEKAYQEVSAIVNDDFDEEKLRKLEYLEMVIKETLRLFPTIPMPIRKATEDVQLGKYLIPAGVDVCFNIFELHRDPTQFNNPLQFNPENFTKENISKRHPYSFIPFSSGMRKCIGGKFSMYVMKVVVSTMLLNYKFECDYKSIDDIKVRNHVSLWMPDGFQVRILNRGKL